MNDIALRLANDLTPQQMATVMADPMLAAPAEIRPNVWRVWTCHAHLFPTPLSIAGSMGRWIREEGLTTDEANEVLRRSLTPTNMAGFRFASDLLVFLSTEAGEYVERRRKLKAMIDRRNGKTEKESDWTAGIGEMPTT